MPFRLRNLKVDRVDLVDQGANQHAHVVLFKRHTTKGNPDTSAVHVDRPIGDEDQRDEYEKATLTSGQRNALPDSAFAAVWTDAKGKKQRKLPYKHPDGSIDRVHLRGALSRVVQEGTQIPDRVLSAAKATLARAAQQAGVGKMARINRTKRFVSQIVKAAKSLLKSDATAGADDTTGAAHLEKLQSMHTALGKAIDECGDASKLPAEHPVHAMKATHAALGEAIKAHQAAMEQTAKAAEEGADGEDDGYDEGADGTDGEDDGEDEGDGSPTAKRLRKQFASVEKTLRAEITKANERATAAEEIAKAERDRRETDEIQGVLKSFTGMSIDVAKHTPLFKALRTSSPELYKNLVETLTGANAAVAKGGLFGELGSGRDGAAKGSAWDQIVAKAEEMVSKSSKGMTREQAIDKVMEQNPRLVREYRAQQQ